MKTLFLEAQREIVDNITNQLNPSQKEAVINFSGPSLVIAGAGSGKTRVLTYRIAYMLSAGVPPHGILALTFTNKAAHEMKNRIASLVGFSMASKLWMGTFHSIFARILRYEAASLGFPPTFTIYDTLDSRNLIKTIVKEFNLDEKSYKPAEILSRISGAKNNLITPDGYAANTTIRAADAASRKPMISEIYTRYSSRCKRAGAMDFDDLLLNTNILFRDYPAVLDKYMNRFSHILVDEYQDTNYSQYLIIRKLAQQHQNICVVGDDAQSIYSFRGARIENILSFQNDYKDARIYKLERNYRSTQNIVEAANSIISRNKDQLKKKVFSENATGDKIKVIFASTDAEEGIVVANTIKDNSLRENLHYRDFAILYRTNAQSRIFEEALRKLNIPYKVYGGVSFFQRKEIKDVLAYFKLTVNPEDDESLKRVINYPLRGIGKTSIDKIESVSIQHDVSLWKVINNQNFLHSTFNTGTQNKIMSFTSLIRDFIGKSTEMEAFDLAFTIVGATGIFKELGGDNTPEGISRRENVEELLNGIKEFTDNPPEKENSGLAGYLQTVTLLTDADNEKEEDNDKVTIMTVHSAKGLEFRQVFLTGLEENLFPSLRSINTQKEIEEERRLFYVAVTRAMDKVYISYTGTRYKWGSPVFCTPSRFINDIDENFLDLPHNYRGGPTPIINENNPARGVYDHRKPIYPPSSAKGKLTNVTNLPTASHNDSKEGFADPSEIVAGSNIEHPRFGKGKVLNTEGSGPNIKATIFFQNHGQKQLLLRFAKLRILG